MIWNRRHFCFDCGTSFCCSRIFRGLLFVAGLSEYQTGSLPNRAGLGLKKSPRQPSEYGTEDQVGKINDYQEAHGKLKTEIADAHGADYRAEHKDRSDD